MMNATSSEAHPAILTAEQKVEFSGYDFPFHNLVCEGGGNKGMSATGAIRVLEELGFIGGIKRFAGASAGAMVASLLAIGYNSHDIEKFLRCDMEALFLDAKFGLLSLLPNMLTSFGWHPGNKINEWFGARVKEKMGKADLTFDELYKRTGRELCITVTNMNNMDCVYCHVKTTPDMAIRKAVRMSACIPGVFCPIQVQFGKSTDYFVDGGLLCNYPIHCYDGWYLSMEAKDSYLQRVLSMDILPQLWDQKERFGAQNDNTFGILLYSDQEREILKDDLKKRFEQQIKPSEKQAYPHSTLAKSRLDKVKKQAAVTETHRVLTAALSKFMKVLRESDVDLSGTINLQEFKMAMNKEDPEFTDEDKKELFGENFHDVETLFKELDVKADGEITFRELLSFAERKGLKFMDHFRGYTRQNITDLRGYFSSIMDTLLLNMKRIFIQGDDVHRTLGINTGYIDTLDFKLDNPDQDFLVQQGKLGCIAFLRELVEDKKMALKS